MKKYLLILLIVIIVSFTLTYYRNPFTFNWFGLYTPVITSLSPTFGVIYTGITITGNRFGFNNEINLKQVDSHGVLLSNLGSITSVYSRSDGTLTFNIPSEIMPQWPLCNNGGCSEVAPTSSEVYPGTYQISVTSDGKTSNSLLLTVLPGDKFVSISSIFPVSGPVGTAIDIKGVNFATTGNVIEIIPLVPSGCGKDESNYSSDGNIIHYTIPTVLTCPGVGTQNNVSKPLVPGDYIIYVINPQKGYNKEEILFKVTH